MKHTCEHCKWWWAMIAGYGKVKSVCWCSESMEHYMMETGAAATCERWQESRTSHFPDAARIVESWPQWKKDIGHKLDRDTEK